MAQRMAVADAVAMIHVTQPDGRSKVCARGMGKAKTARYGPLGSIPKAGTAVLIKAAKSSDVLEGRQCRAPEGIHLMKPACVLALIALPFSALAVDGTVTIPAGSKIYVQPMDGFGSYIIAAIEKKRVPVVIVVDKESADFEIGGDAESQKAGWAKILLTRSAASTEEASINVTNVRTGTVVFAYNVNKQNAARGKQSAAEACAKHLKEVVTLNHAAGKFSEQEQPPPHDQQTAPPPTVGLGMAIDQVVGILGQPEGVADAGTKQIYSYKNLKVTFVNGRVTDVS
jgi:hypothetical protein